MRTGRIARVVALAATIGMLAACEGAIEYNAARRLAPDAPAVDTGLRDLARAHAADSCAAGEVLVTADPDAAYGPGTIELTDRQVLNPSLEPPKDDHDATNRIWQRFRTDPRLDTTSWDVMGVGEARCDDGHLYMTLLLQDDPSSDDPAPGLRRVTAGNAPTLLGGISTDGATVALRSQATNIAPGTTEPDIHLYDVDADTLTPTGLEPVSYPAGVVLTGDGSTVVYDDEIEDPENGFLYTVDAYDVATGTTSRRINPSFAPTSVTSTSADGGVVTYTRGGGGGTTHYASISGAGTRELGEDLGYPFMPSVSDDGTRVALVGDAATVLELPTDTTTTVREECWSLTTPSNGTALSSDGRSLAYGCLAEPTGGDQAQDLFVWDEDGGTTRRLTSEEDGRALRGTPSISDDGRFVAFVYERPDLPSGAATYLWDRTTDRSTFVAPFGSEVAVSGDGGTLAFTAVAPDQPNTAITDLYVWENPAA